MEKIGTIRRIDELGRIVIPKLIRNKMRLKEGDRVVVSYNIEDDTVTVSIHDTYIHNMKEISLIIDSFTLTNFSAFVLILKWISAI